jgi:hypothetical protein
MVSLTVKRGCSQFLLCIAVLSTFFGGALSDGELERSPRPIPIANLNVLYHSRERGREERSSDPHSALVLAVLVVLVPLLIFCLLEIVERLFSIQTFPPSNKCTKSLHRRKAEGGADVVAGEAFVPWVFSLKMTLFVLSVGTIFGTMTTEPPPRATVSVSVVARLL